MKLSQGYSRVRLHITHWKGSELKADHEVTEAHARRVAAALIESRPWVAKEAIVGGDDFPDMIKRATALHVDSEMRLRAENEALREDMAKIIEGCAVVAWAVGKKTHSAALGMPCDAREVGSKIAQAIRAMKGDKPEQEPQR